MVAKAQILLASTLAITSGIALAGDHGTSFSTCGTTTQSQNLTLSGAGIMPADALEYHLSDDLIAALSQPQRELLLSFEHEALTGEAAPHVCLHPDTPPKVAQAFNQFLNNLWGMSSNNPNSFIINARWTNTATDGGGISRGDSITLTYSFAPDGTNIFGQGSSNLINFMNTRIGPGNWEPLFHTALSEWADISGLTFVREMNDDAKQISGGGFSGQLGVRGDIRIGGVYLDGNNGVLAYNYLPNGGDMVIDTGDVGFFSSSFNNYIRLRNVVTHEAGHGIGLLHIESNSNKFLMEPFIDISFTGPQIDDIRGAQRNYGDMDEDNDSFGNASNLNTLAPPGNGAPFVGGDIRSLGLRSMDDNSDIDYYAFTTGEPVTLTAVISPTGGSYQYTAQGGGGGGSYFNATSRSDLQFSIVDSSLATVFSVDDNGVGQDEQGNIDLPAPGQYYLVVDNDNMNDVQTYDIFFLFSTLTLPDCPADLNGDGVVNFVDVSAFVAAFQNQDAEADFNGDGTINFVDVSAFVAAFSAGCP